MKYKYFFGFTILFIVFILSGFLISGFMNPSKDRIISRCSIDLNADGIAEDLILQGSGVNGYADYLSVRSAGKELGRSDLKELKPWKVQAADVDGDGKPEISIGVFKTAKFDPVPAKRPFIYNWDEGGLSPKWLGSRLSRPFDDYVFSDMDSDGLDELISIEYLADGQKVINSYKWKGFGFEGMCESRSFPDIAKLQANTVKGRESSVLKAEIKEKGKWKQIALKYENGELIIY